MLLSVKDSQKNTSSMKSVMQTLRLRPSPRRGKHRNSPESNTTATVQHKDDEDGFGETAPVPELKTPNRHSSPSHRLRHINILRKKQTPEKSPGGTPPGIIRKSSRRSRPERMNDSRPHSQRLHPTINNDRTNLSVAASDASVVPAPLVPEEANRAVQEALAIGSRGDSSLEDEAKQKVTLAVRALDRAGNALFEKGEYDAAFERYERALWLKRRALEGKTSPKHQELLVLQQQQQQQSFTQRQEVQQGIGKNIHRPEHGPEGNDSYNRDTEESSEHTNSVLASVATSINNMTYLMQRSGQASTDETMASYFKSLQIKRDILGPDHLSVGKTLNNIGSVFYLKKEYEAALTAYKDAHRILKNHLGEDHLDVGTIVSNMADVHAASGDTEKALEEYRKALKLRWQLLGKKDPKVIRLMEQIARLETGQQPVLDVSMVDEEEDTEVKHHDQVFKDDIKTLQFELSEDMKYFDLMERQMAIDMVKDKTRIFREMHGIAHPEPKPAETEEKCIPNGIHEVRLPTLEETIATDMEADVEQEKPKLPTPRKRRSGLPQPPAPRLTAHERTKALSSVRARLDRLRDSRSKATVPAEHRPYMDATASSAARITASSTPADTSIRSVDDFIPR